MPLLALLTACCLPTHPDPVGTWEAELAPVVAEAVATDPATLPDGPVSTVVGRKVLVVENGEAREIGRAHV